jgi:hypothetical protein
MEIPVETKMGKSNKGFLKTLRILLAIYAILYLIFIIENFIPSGYFNPWNAENILIKAFFVFFVIGYIISWKSELTAGVIFILWFIGICYLDLVISDAKSGDGIGMGIPLLVLGILYIVYARRKIS